MEKGTTIEEANSSTPSFYDGSSIVGITANNEGTGVDTNKTQENLTRSKEITDKDNSDGEYDDDKDGEKLHQMLTRNRTNGQGSQFSPEVASKVQSLARTLSQHRLSDGSLSLPAQDDEDGFNAERILRHFVRDASSQGIDFRKTGVIMEDVAVTGIDTSSLEGSTFMDLVLLPYTILKGIQKKRRQQMRKIIQNANVLAKPGEMVLVLGRPGSGCSSFLKTVAGVTNQFAGGVQGDISYDGIPQDVMMKNYGSDVIYNPELDVHFPFLTVKQTLDFAIACKTPAVRVNNVSRKEHIRSTRDLYATIFGLTHTYNTKVGNDFVRGVSGGERKRVSIAEALAARGTVYSWDNATRGLDASTALEYAQAIRIMTNLLKSTAFVTIYQASENIYETFDKVTVLHSGRQIYFGSIKDAKDYFAKMGYLCPPRQATAEFLTALTDPNGYHKIRPGYEHKVPRTAEEFENYWLNSEEFTNLKNDIQEYKASVNRESTQHFFSETMKAEKSRFARNKSYYTVSFPEQVRLCTVRGFQKIYGNKAYTVINTIAAIIQAFVTGSAFYNSPSSTTGAFSRGGVLYFALLYYSLMGLANISFDHRPILQKHKTYSLYHPAAEALGDTFSGAPFRLIGLTCFIIILYFLAGLNRTAASFFRTYWFLAMCSEAIYALFDFIAAACDDMQQASSISGLIMFSLSMYSTYMIQLPNMHPWFKWISYVLPIRYAFESMLEAEFHGRHMSCGSESLVPSGPGYENVSGSHRVCAFIGSKKGQSWVLGDDYLNVQYTYKYWHLWRNVGILFAFLIGYIVLKAILTEIKNPVKGSGEALIFKKGSRKNIAKQKDSSQDLEAMDQMNMQDSRKINSSTEGRIDSSDSSDETRNDNEKFGTGAIEGFGSKGVFIWQDVTYVIPYQGAERTLLDHVTGYVAPGTMTALMGESGAGKTTLLNTLAKRVNVGVVTGDMLINGRPVDNSFERRTGYVQQQDIHISQMTVRESLVFSARLRRPQSVPDAVKVADAETVMKLLDMEAYGDALVGAIGAGLNVEQRKKLSIGVELVAKPDLLLFLDEPTSGLDSQSSWAIVQLLRRIAKAGQCILCTIHQPSATLFEQFDRLLLLKKGGQTVYFGDIGENSATVLDYFERNGARHCEQKENPAEYILEAIGAGATASVKEDWHEIWQRSDECRATDQRVSEWIHELSSKDFDAGEVGIKPSKYATSYFYQFRYVWLRTNLTLFRDLRYIFSKFMLQITSGLYIGWTFYNPGKSYVGLQDTLFAAFVSVIVSAPCMKQIQAKALASRALFEVRESKSNMFHWSLILLTQYMAEIPYHFLFSTMFFCAFYFPLRVWFEASRSAVFFLNYCIMFQLFYVGLGLMVLYMSPNLPSANVIMGLLLSMMIQFCGVTQPMSLMPGFWTFMWKASPYTYFIQNLVGIVLHKKPVVCKNKELNYFDPPQGKTCGEYMHTFLQRSPGYIANPKATSDCAYCEVSVGDEYLSQRGVYYGNIWRNFGFFWAYIVFNLFAMVGVYYLFSVKGLKILNPFAFIKKHIRRK